MQEGFSAGIVEYLNQSHFKLIVITFATTEKRRLQFLDSLVPSKIYYSRFN